MGPSCGVPRHGVYSTDAQLPYFEWNRPLLHFRTSYLLAMREQAPKMFNELRRTGAMDAHLDRKMAEAGQLYRDLIGDRTDMQAEREATEQVYATLIAFPRSDADAESQDNYGGTG